MWPKPRFSAEVFWGFFAKNYVFRISKVLEILKNFFQEVFEWGFRGNAPKYLIKIHIFGAW